MNKFKFVYFDLGGVVVKDFSKTNKWAVMKRVMGVRKAFDSNFDELYTKYELEELCLTRHVDSLIPIFAKKFKMKFPPHFSMLKYIVDNFEANNSMWPVLEKVKQICKVGLLTNQYIDMFDLIVKRQLIPPIDWDVIIDSTKVKLQKPDLSIYALAEKLSGVGNNEIFFVDNIQRNIDAAKKFGWKTFLYDSADDKQSCKKLLKFFLKC